MKRPSGGAVVVIVVVVLLVLMPAFYVLSIGPVVGLYSRGAIGPSMEPVLETIYTPLEMGTDLFPPGERALQLYISWWDVTAAAPVVTAPSPALAAPSPAAPAAPATGT